MYRYIVGPTSSKLIAAELARADRHASWPPATPAPVAREAAPQAKPAPTVARRRPRWVVRALRLAH